MAQIEARLPMVATRTPVTGSAPEYSGATPIGKLIAVTMTPNSGSVDLYGDDEIAESVTTPTQETISLNTTTLPLAAAAVVLGITVETDTSQTGLKEDHVSYANEEAPFVGFGFIDVEIVNNVRSFVVNFYPNCKFQRPARTSNTRGQTVAFSTPTISGVAYYDDAYGALRDEYRYTGTGAADAAVAKLKELLGET